MKIGSFAARIFNLYKMDDVPDGADFDLGLIDVLIARAIDRADKAGKQHSEFIKIMLKMALERSMEWGFDNEDLLRETWLNNNQ